MGKKREISRQTGRLGRYVHDDCSARLMCLCIIGASGSETLPLSCFGTKDKKSNRRREKILFVGTHRGECDDERIRAKNEVLKDCLYEKV